MNQTAPEALNLQLLTPDYANIWPLSPLAWMGLIILLIIIAAVVFLIVFLVKHQRTQIKIKQKQSLWLTKIDTIYSDTLTSEQFSSELAELLLAASEKKHLEQIDVDFYKAHKTLFDSRYNGKALSDEQKKHLHSVSLTKLKELAPWN